MTIKDVDAIAGAVRIAANGDSEEFANVLDAYYAARKIAEGVDKETEELKRKNDELDREFWRMMTLYFDCTRERMEDFREKERQELDAPTIQHYITRPVQLEEDDIAAFREQRYMDEDTAKIINEALTNRRRFG